MRLPSIAAALLFAAPALGQTGPYRAQGPDWSMTIDGKAARIALPGKPLRIEPLPPAETDGDSRRYLTRDVLIDAAHFPCTDGRSGRVWPDSVFLRVDNLAYKGCGGTPVTSPARTASLRGEWRIVALHGRRVSGETSPSIRFEGGRASGDASCNRFATTYRLARGQLRFAPVARTERFCDKRIRNVQEASILDFLATPLRASAIGGRLVLASDKGETMLLERAPGR